MLLFGGLANMITRVWYGWTAPENADVYEALFKDDILPSIQNRQVEGYEGIQLMRRDSPDEREFVTVMWFTSLEAVKAFAGESYESSVVPERAREVLKKFSAFSYHYELKADTAGSASG